MYIPYKKAAVVEIPKCASRSLKTVISSVFSVSSAGNHATLTQYKKAHPELSFGYAVIRNPLERLKSAVQHSSYHSYPKKGISEIKYDLAALSRGDDQRLSNIILYPQYSFLMCSAPVRIYSMAAIPNLLSDLGINLAAPVEGLAEVDLPLEEILAVFGEDFVNNFYSIDFAAYKGLSSCAGGVMEVDDARDYFYSLR
jgi:hypothetical protein